MPLFCSEFAWCSPAAYAALTIEEYLTLRDHLAKRFGANDAG